MSTDIGKSTPRSEESVMEHEHDQGTQDEQGEGKLTDELLEEKLHEGSGPLPFIPGGEKLEAPVPKSEPLVPESAPEGGDELLEEKLHEGRGSLLFIPGGEKSEPPVAESTPEAR
jgi:hypothetical protein